MSCYSNLLSGLPEFRSLTDHINKKHFPFGCLGLSNSPKALVIHSAIAETGRKALVIVPDEAFAEKLCSDLRTFGTRACTFPARDFSLQGADTSSREFEQKRIGALSRCLNGECEVLISSAEAVMQRTIDPDTLASRIFTVRAGQTVTEEAICELLVKGGYTSAEMVEGAGQFSLRGGILDVFPSDRDKPVRIEFWGDEIDTISEFDILSQRREESLDKISVSPVTEVLYDSAESLADKIENLAKTLRGKNAPKTKESLFADADMLRAGIRPGSCDRYIPLIYSLCTTVLDYFNDGMLFVCETRTVKAKMTEAEKLLNEDIKSLFLEGTLCRGLDKFTLSKDEIIKDYAVRDTVYFDNFAPGTFDTPVKALINFEINQMSQWDGSYKVLLDDILPCLEKKYTVLIFAGAEKSAQALLNDLKDDGHDAFLYGELPDKFALGKINIVSGAISYGLDIPKNAPLIVVSYGRYTKISKPSAKHKKNSNSFNSLEELHPGDYIVHESCGIGVFDGIINKRVAGVSQDFIRIRYAKDDVLYVPVTKLDLISKYIGPHEEDGARSVKLSRLGSGDWEKTKSRVRGAAKDIAEDLIRLYAKRQAAPGYAFSFDDDMQRDFESRFEFDETDDQLRCISEIKHDMEKPCPMDRLLCGDVGFGKTEVALRAAFKCIYDGKQVAFLVPTTILAYQHFRTISHRFDGFPIEAEMLSRFRDKKEQEKIAKRIKDGEIDIVVGTQRLLSKDIAFKDLGLLIVDEEQRFGVAQKEKLKEKFPSVDVLTLSATPIPRTLNLAMSGLRDLSVIEEAPMDRFPVQTYVIEHEPGIIAQAISKELRRGGQVYYLHNVTNDIEDKAAELQKTFPEASIAVAHGKMKEEELSDVWQKLIDGETDILVCTTIIETGVDVPNVNTLIIEDANRMGLAQLHQIRGRVGRSTRRASAYLTFRQDRQLTEIADRRLSAIREFSQFGAGFKIAMRDLEIRGAGSLLGAAQSGNIFSVGYDMYMQILSEEVEKMKTGENTYVPKKECSVDLHIDAYIPESYIPSYPQRIAIYKRIADISTKEDSYDVTDELIDRYGEPPMCAIGLIEVALLRNAAAENDIYEITQKDDCICLYVKVFDPALIGKMKNFKGRLYIFPNDKPYFKVRIGKGQTPLECLEEIIDAISVSKEEEAT